MSNTIFYLNLIGCEIVLILRIVVPLLDDKVTKRALSTLSVAIVGFMLAEFVSHILANRLADFIYSSHYEYRSLKYRG